MWKRPQPAAAAAGGTSGGTSTGKPSSAAAAASGDAAYLLPEDSEDAANYVSEYEKAHPLVMPKALSQVRLAGQGKIALLPTFTSAGCTYVLGFCWLCRFA
jgi:hypothetical protein